MTPRILLAALAALALTAAPAMGQTAKPAPCTGLQAQDAQGDAFVGFIGLFETPVAGAPQVDYKGLFFRRDGGKITLNAVMADLKKQVPPDASAVSWRLLYTQGDVQYYVQATLMAGAAEATFTYGHIENTLVKDGDTKGAFFEGPDGVLQVEIPAAQGLKPDAKISDVYMFSAYVRGAVNTQTDQIPDGDARTKWTASECPSGQPEPGSGPPPAPTTPVGSDPNSPPPAAPINKPGSGSGAATGPLQIAVKPTALKAKKVKRSLTLALTCREALTNLTVQFKKGAKKLAAGKLAKCSGKGTIKLKIKAKLKKGAHTFVFAGKRADTSSGRLTVKVKVS